MFATITQAHLEWADRVLAHALENYNSDGWDIVVECYDRQDLADKFAQADCDSYDVAFREIATTARLQDNHRQELQGY